MLSPALAPRPGALRGRSRLFPPPATATIRLDGDAPAARRRRRDAASVGPIRHQRETRHPVETCARGIGEPRPHAAARPVGDAGQLEAQHASGATVSTAPRCSASPRPARSTLVDHESALVVVVRDHAVVARPGEPRGAEAPRSPRRSGRPSAARASGRGTGEERGGKRDVVRHAVSFRSAWKEECGFLAADEASGRRRP